MQKNRTMKERPQSMRPYERCLAEDAGSLRDDELLSVILRTGTTGISALDLADTVLSSCPYAYGLPGMVHMTIPELMQIRGIGAVKAVQIRCIGELSRRIARSEMSKRPAFYQPEEIALFYMESLRHKEQECVHAMMLDTRNRLLRDVELTKGTVNTSLFSPRELYISALSFHAVRVVLVHNHPSGDASPSTEDVRMTEKTVKAGEMIGIPLLDHIVIGDGIYASIREQFPQVFCFRK